MNERVKVLNILLNEADVHSGFFAADAQDCNRCPRAAGQRAHVPDTRMPCAHAERTSCFHCSSRILPTLSPNPVSRVRP